MENLQIFENVEFGKIRTIEENGKILFCGSDVAKILGYKDTAKAIKTHCKEDGWAICPVIDSLGRKQQTKFISEGNVYRLITHSKLPNAEKFENWVFDEVLPSIRKHGIYADATVIESMFRNPDVMIKFFTKLKTEQEQRIKLEQEVNLLIPDANMARDIIKYNGLYTLKEVADLIEKGRIELCTLLRTSEVLSKQTGYNLPLRRYTKQGYFKIKINEKTNVPVTLITPLVWVNVPVLLIPTSARLPPVMCTFPAQVSSELSVILPPDCSKIALLFITTVESAVIVPCETVSFAAVFPSPMFTVPPSSKSLVLFKSNFLPVMFKVPSI